MSSNMRTFRLWECTDGTQDLVDCATGDITYMNVELGPASELVRQSERRALVEYEHDRKEAMLTLAMSIIESKSLGNLEPHERTFVAMYKQMYD